MESQARGLMADLTVSLAFLCLQDVFENLLCFATTCSGEVVTLCLCNRGKSHFCEKKTGFTRRNNEYHKHISA